MPERFTKKCSEKMLKNFLKLPLEDVLEACLGEYLRKKFLKISIKKKKHEKLQEELWK